MSLAQRFERRLEGLVGGAFARVFKGQVEPVEIGRALQREAADKRNVMGGGDGPGRVLSPNRYRVTLSPSDHDRLAPWEAPLSNSLAELVQDYLDENRWDTIGDIEVYLARDEDLRTGVFGVASRMESAAPPRIRPHDSLSLPVVAGQQPGQYPPDQRYGQQAQQYGQGYGQPPGGPPQQFPPQFPPNQYPPEEFAPGGFGQGQFPPGQFPPGPAFPAPPVGMPPNPAPQFAPPPRPPIPAGGGFPPGPAPARPAPQPGPAGPPQGPQQGGPQFGGQQYGPPPGPANRPASAMLIVDQSNRRFDLRPGSNVIGRGTDSDLQLLDQGISRRHVDVQFDGHHATAYDLGSTNGTTVNGHEIGSQVLRHGDVIRVGHTRIVFHQGRG